MTYSIDDVLAHIDRVQRQCEDLGLWSRAAFYAERWRRVAVLR